MKIFLYILRTIIFIGLWCAFLFLVLFFLMTDFNSAWCAARAPGCPEGVKSTSYSIWILPLLIVNIYFSVKLLGFFRKKINADENKNNNS